MASPKRSIIEVIQKMLNLIPLSETKLISELTEYRNSLWNRAPEVRDSAECWIPLQNIMNSNIREIDMNWKIDIVHIFNRAY